LRQPLDEHSETRFQSPLPADRDRRYSPSSAPPRVGEKQGLKPEG
jgi:hypothetical protein